MSRKRNLCDFKVAEGLVQYTRSDMGCGLSIAGMDRTPCYGRCEGTKRKRGLVRDGKQDGLFDERGTITSSGL